MLQRLKEPEINRTIAEEWRTAASMDDVRLRKEVGGEFTMTNDGILYTPAEGNFNYTAFSSNPPEGTTILTWHAHPHEGAAPRGGVWNPKPNKSDLGLITQHGAGRMTPHIIVNHTQVYMIDPRLNVSVLGTRTEIFGP